MCYTALCENGTLYFYSYCGGISVTLRTGYDSRGNMDFSTITSSFQLNEYDFSNRTSSFKIFYKVPPHGCVRVFSEPDYEGGTKVWCRDQRHLGDFDNAISSLIVGDETDVKFYNNENYRLGSGYTYFSYNWDTYVRLVGTAFNNQFSSLIFQ